MSTEVRCKQCGKMHRVHYGCFPTASDKLLDFAIIVDPVDAEHLILVMCFYLEQGSVACALSCQLADEAVFNYLDRLPFESIGVPWADAIQPKEKILSSGFDAFVFKTIKTLLRTDQLFQEHFRDWAADA